MEFHDKTDQTERSFKQNNNKKEELEIDDMDGNEEGTEDGGSSRRIDGSGNNQDVATGDTATSDTKKAGGHKKRVETEPQSHQNTYDASSSHEPETEQECSAPSASSSTPESDNINSNTLRGAQRSVASEAVSQKPTVDGLQ